MSGAVEDEIVRMSFDNSRFQRGVSASLSTLDKLKNSLKFNGATKGLDSVERRANSMNLNHISTAVDGISKKFSALSVVGIAALASIATKAVSAGLQMAKSFSVQPILDGFHEYETQLNSVQTILANTGLKGDAGMGQVNAALNELNTYSDKTIYNFSEMARNIGTFTAAGVKLKPATSAIKGIANVAALSGSSSEQASTAMYQLSQAIANNKVGLQDWNSVVNAGMGGKVFQQALFNVGKMKGTLKDVKPAETFDQWTKAGNSFRDSLKSGWITGDVLTTTLSQFTGDLTDAQLKAQGYNKTQIAQIQEQARTAADAATKVKTFTQLMGTLKEAVGSGWSQSFLTIFGNFNEAKDLWTGVSNSVGQLISNSAKARNRVLKDWKAMGGRTLLIDGIKAAFQALGAAVKPIKDAFRELFPKKTGADLEALTFRFRNFMQSLIIGPETADKLRRSFAGLFAVFKIAKTIVGGVFNVLKNLFKSMTGGGGSFLDITAKVGDFLVKLNDAIQRGDSLTGFFKGLGIVLATPVQLIKAAAKFIGSLFDGFSPTDAQTFADSLKNIGDRFAHISSIGGRISDAFNKVKARMQPVIDAIVNGFGTLSDKVAEALHGVTFDRVISIIKTALFGGLVVMIKKFFSNGINVDVGGGFLGKIGETFDALTAKTKAMTLEIKANTLLKIAGAIGILAASVLVLSTIDPKRLADSLKAMAVGFGELLGSMAILIKISGNAGFVKIPLIAASMTLLAGSILILTLALRSMANLSWDQLEKGLVGVGGLLLAISVAVIPLSKSSGGMVRVGIGLMAIALAMNGLYFAVKNFASLSWQQIGKGLGSVAIALTAIAIAMRLMPKGMMLTAAGVLEVSVALNALYLAVREFASMSWGEMGKGLLGVAGGLVAIALGMKLMPKGMIRQSAGLLILSAALLVLGQAIKQMGNLGFDVIGKGLGTIAASLLILALGLKAMNKTLGGSTALLIAAGALAVLVPVIISLGSVDMSTLAKGILGLGAALAVIALGARLITPGIPAILALGVAALALGAAMALAGVGIGAMADGLAILAKSGSAGVKVLLEAFAGLIKQLPDLAVALAKAIALFIVTIGKNIGPVAVAFGKIVGAILKVIIENTPKIVEAGIKLILELVNALAKNAPKLVKAIADLILALLKGLGDNLPRLLQGAATFILNFLDGLATTIKNNEGKIITAAAKVGVALIEGLWDGIKGLLSWLWDKFTGFFSWLWSKIKGWFGIHSPSTKMAEIGKALIQGLWNGITGVAKWLWGKITGFFGSLWKLFKSLIKGAINIGSSLIHFLWNGITGAVKWLWGKVSSFFTGLWRFSAGLVVNAAKVGAKIITFIWHGITSMISWLWGKVKGMLGKLWDVMKSALGGVLKVGEAIVKGVWNGIKGLFGWLRDKVLGLFGGLLNKLKSAFDGFGIGSNMLDGVMQGIRDGIPGLVDTASHAALAASGAVKDHMKIASPSKLMAWMGRMFVEGFANGIRKHTGVSTDAAALMGKKVTDTIQNRLKAKGANFGIDVNPTITPVLDLTNVQKDASRIGGMLGTTPLSASVSYDSAASISATHQDFADAQAAAPTETAPTVVSLQQNNYSPKALSAVDIYRNTRNQLALAKDALASSN